MEGWIKLHRKLLEDPIFSSSKGLKIWLWCLMKATHKKYECYIGIKKITLNEGQFIMGRDTAHKELKIAVGTTWNWMKQLETERYIKRQPTNKYTIITILNWSKYQTEECETERRLNAERTQNEPYKNNKNEKNILQTKVCEEFSSNKHIDSLLESKQRHIHIIGLFFSYKELVFENLAQIQAQMKRLFRPAKNLEGYPDDRILATMDILDKESQQDKKYVWGLETILKRIDIIK